VKLEMESFGPPVMFRASSGDFVAIYPSPDPFPKEGGRRKTQPANRGTRFDDRVTPLAAAFPLRSGLTRRTVACSLRGLPNQTLQLSWIRGPGPTPQRRCGLRGRRTDCRLASSPGFAQAPGCVQFLPGSFGQQGCVLQAGRAHAGVIVEADAQEILACLCRVDHSAAHEVGRGAGNCQQCG
jgi:hypothetical protein